MRTQEGHIAWGLLAALGLVSVLAAASRPVTASVSDGVVQSRDLEAAAAAAAIADLARESAASASASVNGGAHDSLAAVSPAPNARSAETPAPAIGEQQPPACRPWTEPAGTVRVRRNIASLPAVQLTALKRAVSAMKGRPQSDPTSWLYQANIHGFSGEETLPAWKTCQHGNYLFFAWHRMYLYFFERILRKASGDDGFALPYWNYTIAAQAPLPLAYRRPANASNVLFVAQRAAAINAGQPVPASATSFSAAFTYTNFTSAPGSGLSFGGPSVPGPMHFSSPAGRLESLPHNAIHVVVGGNTGWMSDPDLAARDPIFWAHHANIDRLWSRWVALGGGRQDPPSADSIWQNTPFTFFDETGACVTMTGKQVLDTATQLHYRYDDATPTARPRVTTQAAPPAGTGGQTNVLAEAAQTGAVQLSGERARVPVAIKEAQRGAVRAMAAAAPPASQRLTLLLEEIDYEQGAYYEVYLNLPDTVKAPTSTSPYFVGVLAPFAMKPHGGGKAAVKMDFDITAVVKTLTARKLWKGEEMHLTFVPAGAVSGGVRASAAERRPETGKMSIGRMQVVSSGPR